MYDPFLDTFNEPQSLQKPLVPSRSTTPAIPSSNPQIEASSSSPPQEIEVKPQSSDVTALFDPLGGLTPTPRASQTSFPSGSLNRPPADATNQPSKRRPMLLNIATPSNPPQPVSADPLSDLLGTQHKPSSQPSVEDRPRPKAARQFTTPPLFQPPQPTYMVLPRPPLSRHPSRTGSSHAHAREPSDDFGGFISVPASLDPLSNSTNNSTTNVAATVAATASSSTEKLTTTTTAWNEFTTAAQQRHAQNSSRILGEFAHIESSDGDFLGWLDDEAEAAKDDEERKKWLAERDQKLKNEEGPHSPPGTPAEGPPPTTRTPKKKIKRDDDAHATATTTYASYEPEIMETPLKDVEPTREKSTSRERTEGGGPIGSTSTGGFGSYFPATLPRRLTTLISTPMPATASMSPTIRVPRSADRESVEGGHQKEASDPDPKAVFALPGASSLENLSSIHPPYVHPASKTRPVPDSFLTHNTPFATVKYIPPTGAPGYAGEGGWDTGGFADDWEGEGLVNGEEANRKKAAQQLRIKRVLKLIGRKEETAGVLTRALGDALRLHLPALARLCTTWTLLYSLDQHGISLHTFYNLSGPSASSTNKVSGGRKGALVIVRDSMDGVFGAWIGEGIRMIGSGSGHYGGGYSFLWKTNSTVPDPSQEPEDDPLPELTIYKWTGKNDYIALCEPDFMSLGGGGDGKTGLYLDSNLLDGSSAKSMTFDNDILCAEEEDPDTINGMGVPHLEGRTAKFEVIGLEVWGLVAS